MERPTVRGPVASSFGEFGQDRDYCSGRWLLLFAKDYLLQFGKLNSLSLVLLKGLGEQLPKLGILLP